MVDFALGETADSIRDTARCFVADKIAPLAGYTKEWPTERFLRDAKLDIGAGTNETGRFRVGRELVGGR